MREYGYGAEPEAPFMCECGASLCDERIWMSGAEYEASAGPVLAARHDPDAAGLETRAVPGRRRRDERR